MSSVVSRFQSKDVHLCSATHRDASWRSRTSLVRRRGRAWGTLHVLRLLAAGGGPGSLPLAASGCHFCCLLGPFVVCSSGTMFLLLDGSGATGWGPSLSLPCVVLVEAAGVVAHPVVPHPRPVVSAGCRLVPLVQVQPARAFFLCLCLQEAEGPYRMSLCVGRRRAGGPCPIPALPRHPWALSSWQL